MALALSSAALSYTAPAAMPAGVARAASPVMESIADLKVVASKLNPAVGFWDPLKLSEAEFYDYTNEETIGWLRHAEIKHGRVAMAGFVGYCLQANGVKFPWEPFASITAEAPAAQWDALPAAAKLQIIGFIGFLEIFSEHSYILEAQGEKHYMKGGKPGYFPSLKAGFGVHPVPFDLYDPLNFSTTASAEKKAKGLNMEVNNGRLAMIGLMGLLAEARAPGALPFGPPQPAYSGDVMAPFSADFQSAGGALAAAVAPFNL